jgi:hypothetical protein
MYSRSIMMKNWLYVKCTIEENEKKFFDDDGSEDDSEEEMDVDGEKDKSSEGQKGHDEEGLSEWGGKWLSLAPDTRKPLPLRM